MTPPDPPRPIPSDPALRDALMALVGFGVRLTQAATEIAEAEARVVAVMTANLPAAPQPASMDEAQAIGHAVDAADIALAQAAPRITAAGQTYERVSRAMRRTAALIQRIDSGWRPRGSSDNRRAMARRHIARVVGEHITRHSGGEAAERLFDGLDDRLDAMETDGDLDRPVDELIEAICRDLGLPALPSQPPQHPASATNPQGDTPDG